MEGKLVSFTLVAATIGVREVLAVVVLLSLVAAKVDEEEVTDPDSLGVGIRGRGSDMGDDSSCSFIVAADDDDEIQDGVLCL